MKEKLYLIAYDIADPRRLGRVARHVRQYACRVQYSVFAASLTRTRLDRLLAELETLIDTRHDDVRAYPLPARGEVTLMGEQFLAANTLLLQNGYSRFVLIQDSTGGEPLPLGVD